MKILVQAAANPFMGMGEPVTSSPAKPKSAFDDLEDVMRMSLGSPAKNQPITQQPQPKPPLVVNQSQPSANQPQPSVFGDVMSMPVQPMMFGSPARQPMMAMGSISVLDLGFFLF